MIAFGGEALDAAIEELSYVQGLSVPFTSDAVLDEVFLPMADLVAAEIAQHYSVQGPMRSRAIARIRAALVQDDR